MNYNRLKLSRIHSVALFMSPDIPYRKSGPFDSIAVDGYEYLRQLKEEKEQPLLLLNAT